MLASIYLNDQPPVEADKVEYEGLEWNLASKLELRQPAIAQ